MVARPCLSPSFETRAKSALLRTRLIDDVYRFELWNPGLYFGRRAVERFLHSRGHALALEGLFVLLAQKRILQPIGDRGAALRHVDRAFVGVLLAGDAGLVLAVVVGTVPADQSQRVLADAEMGVEPVATIGRGGDDADRLVILAIDLVGLAVLPRRHPDRARPCVGVALALDADEHRGRSVGVGLGVAPGDVLADELVEYVAGERWLEAAVAGRAPVVEIELGIENVGH